MPNIHDTNRKRGMSFRIRYAENWHNLAKSDRLSVEKRLQLLEAHINDSSTDNKIRNNRRGLENRFRAIEGDL